MKFSDLIKNHKQEVFAKIGFHQQKILSILEKCRTPKLGAHLYVCEDCKSVHLLSNSCGNRNCPVCQGNKRKRWIEKQCDNLVNVPYFHVVFTVPDVLNTLFLNHQADCYTVLYHAGWNTLKLFFANDRSLSGKGGMFCILHTWGQTLTFHPHLHCLVPAAGIGKDGELKQVKGKDQFLFDVKNMSKVFRAKFAEELTWLEKSAKLKVPEITRKLMFSKNWVVFSQRPFSTPENVVRYIAMYSHRVAISENRILDDKDGMISFSYKDYKDQGKKKIMPLNAQEFLRRFAMHILPWRFTKIRYYGLLNNRNKKDFLQLAAKTVGKYKITAPQNSPSEDLQTALDEELDDEPMIKNRALICPVCKTGKLRKIASFESCELINGITVVNITTGEIVYQSRAGPVNNEFKVKKTVI